VLLVLLLLEMVVLLLLGLLLLLLLVVLLVLVLLLLVLLVVVLVVVVLLLVVLLMGYTWPRVHRAAPECIVRLDHSSTSPAGTTHYPGTELPISFWRSCVEMKDSYLEDENPIKRTVRSGPRGGLHGS
jgi:hypothetical protein